MRTLDPARARSVVRMRVRFCDTDLMGIVHHANYFAYFEAGRVAWLRRRGISYNAWAAGGHHLPVVEANIRYRSPARFDDLLEVETVLAQLGAASLRFDYFIRKEKILLCEGFTRLALVGADQKLARFTEEMLTVLDRADAGADELEG
jgi:acyl-CoA thioester hydrolase